MSKNKNGILLSLLIISILSVATLSGGAFKSAEKGIIPTANPKSSSGWYNLSTSLASSIPDVYINFSRNGIMRSFNMEQIVEYTSYENQSFSLVNFTINKESNVEVIGFNPIFLMQIAGWTDVYNFTVVANDGYSRQANITQLLLADSEFVKYTDTDNETILVIACEGQWLASYLFDDESYGDFYFYGENLSSKQMIYNITTITYDDPWTVRIVVNGTEEAYLNTLNGTTSTVGNYTTYNWGYFDTNAGYGWDARDITGFTVESLLQHTSVGERNYTISFIAYDGYGANKVFTKSQIEDGYTGFMINDPQEELLHEGKQAMLMEKEDGDSLDFLKGPYQVIIPGIDKASYIGGIVEIRITLIETTESKNDSTIPGYSLGFTIASFAVAIALVMKKRN